MVGVYVAEALAITYASCQATKLPRIMGTLLLVPAARCLLERLGQEGSQMTPRRLFFVLLGCSITAILGTIGSLAYASL